jgi:KDO2-lipid IV(A) lauroyltransferase
VSFLVDQHAKEKEGVLTSFFGHPALTHKSPALLHLKTGVPIVLLMPRRISNDFKFEFIISDPITMTPSKNNDDDVQKLMQIITTETEKVIAKYPEQWLWAHRRWLDINRDESAQM